MDIRHSYLIHYLENNKSDLIDYDDYDLSKEEQAEENILEDLIEFSIGNMDKEIERLRGKNLVEIAKGWWLDIPELWEDLGVSEDTGRKVVLAFAGYLKDKNYGS